MAERIAVVLFNLGGPDSQEAVKPFLFNLFSDKAIIRLPNPLRFFIATLISSKRAPIAREIYQKIGGCSPILPQTQAQAQALEEVLNAKKNGQWKTFIAMRYWHPFAKDTAKEVEVFAPDRVVLLPLYPQFSTTTSASSLAEWKSYAPSVPHSVVCCYPQDGGFIAAVVEIVRQAYAEAKASHPHVRVLFSAHGLPEKIVRDGDSYQWQVEQSVVAVQEKLALPDYAICYQSRVGPMQWIGPSTEDCIRKAGKESVALVIVPIAFVSEHSETLVELDMEYRHLAEEAGVPGYFRAATVTTHPAFIAGLAKLCEDARDGKTASSNRVRICPKAYCGCVAA